MQAMLKLNKNSTVNVQRYQRVSAERAQAMQPAQGYNTRYQRVSAERTQAMQLAQGCNTRLGTFRSTKISCTKASIVSDGLASNGSGNPVFAFGLKHAERARNLYQS